MNALQHPVSYSATSFVAFPGVYSTEITEGGQVSYVAPTGSSGGIIRKTGALSRQQMAQLSSLCDALPAGFELADDFPNSRLHLEFGRLQFTWSGGQNIPDSVSNLVDFLDEIRRSL